MTKLLAYFFCLVCVFYNSKIQAQTKRIQSLPSKAQLSWHEKEFYLFIHFGPNTFTNEEWGHGNEDPKIFNPSNLDCDQWVKVAKQSGAKGIILTAKHHDGFCLWPSKQSTHTVRESNWLDGKGDVVKALSDACKKGGIEMGVYLSPWDRNHPKYGTPEYNDVYLATMKELLTNYGSFFELWWDGANGEGPNGKKQVYDFKRFQDSAFAWQPQIIIFSDIGPSIRWCGNESGIINSTNWNYLDTAGFTPGQGAPHPDTLNRGNYHGKSWIPAEADVSIRPGWFYHASEDSKVKTPKKLFNLYLSSVGNGGNLLLNVPPNRMGRIHPYDSLSLIEFYQLKKKAFANNLFTPAYLKQDCAKKYAPLFDLNASNFYQLNQSNNRVIDLNFKKPISFNSIVLEEMIANGQNVASFVISVPIDGQFKSIYQGTTIGRKKIAVFPTTLSPSIRIEILETKSIAEIKSISAYLINPNLLD